MELQDGHVIYCTKKRTWYEVLLHELAFDNRFYYQSDSSFDFKYIPSHQRREKEGRCKNLFIQTISSLKTIVKTLKSNYKPYVCSMVCFYYINKFCSL